MINSPPVQWYSNFWSSSLIHLLLFMFQSPHPCCLVFIVVVIQYNQVQYVSSIRSRTATFPPHSLSLFRKGLGTRYIGPFYLLPPPLLHHHELIFHNHCFYHHLISMSSTGIVCSWGRGNCDDWHMEDCREPRQLRRISSFRDQFLLHKN